MSSRFIYVNRLALTSLASAILNSYGLVDSDSQTVVDVLLKADARGIPSHGMAHLERHLADIKLGLSKPSHQPLIIREKGATALIDGNHSFGAPTSLFAMKKAIHLAKNYGIGAVSVGNSAHHGISGYYAMMALEHNMLGYCSTNTAALAAPTFGTQARFGTNPIAFAAPSYKLPPFVLDMSSTVVTRGAIELCAQSNSPIQDGWAIDRNGLLPNNASQFLEDLLSFSGGLLPLGGQGTSHGGHKGYGLAIMVDILCGILSSSNFGVNVHDTKDSAACVSHFFMAIDIEAFREINGFKADMDTMLTTLLKTKPVEGVARVVYAGLEAHEKELLSHHQGIPILPHVVAKLNSLAAHLKINPLT